MHLSPSTMVWLKSALSGSSDPEGLAGDYLDGRGLSEDLRAKLGQKLWVPPDDPCPDLHWSRLYGSKGEAFADKIVTPIWSPCGSLLGVEFRTPFKKDFHRLVSEASRWHPLWVGMPWMMSMVWKQRRVALVEGMYDAAPLWRAFPNFPVLACGTAAVSRAQRIFLRRFVDEVWIVFDNDPAGHRGCEQSSRSLFATHKVHSCVKYGRLGDDPGKVWDRGGLEEVRRAFAFLEV